MAREDAGGSAADDIETRGTARATTPRYYSCQVIANMSFYVNVIYLLYLEVKLDEKLTIFLKEEFWWMISFYPSFGKQ